MTGTGLLGRGTRRFLRRSTAMKIRMLVILVMALAVVIGYVVLAPGSSIKQIAGVNAKSYGDHHGSFTPVTDASATTRGIVNNEINVIFPVVSLSSLTGQEGLAMDKENGQQDQAINLYVNDINKEGGINGRRINAMIVPFDPANEAEMRGLCKQWTEGSPAAFAVLDGIGAWQDEDELCITQEGHTPMISAWTTVTDWTNAGSPYLWWTGPDQAAILNTVVHWGLSSGKIRKSQPLGIVVGDLASDQIALNQYLLPDLKTLGITDVDVEELAAGTSETASTNAEAPLVVEKLKSEGVKTVLPMLRANAFFPYLASEASQKYYPALLLSDYQSEIQSGLGLIPIPFEKELNGQEGVTTLTLGGVDDDAPESQGGYDPGVRKCWNEWHAAYPAIKDNDFIEEQGPIVAWCGVIDLFAAAAKKAGKNLNRRTFVEAMASRQDFPGTWTPVLSYGSDKFYGPTEYRIVEIRNNVPPSSQCYLLKDGKAQGTCWVVKEKWKTLYPPT
jgi:hypothetical protein